jgi:very-short-patch-repair endonuclease
MPRLAVVPSELAFVPFRGSAAVSSGLFTRDVRGRLIGRVDLAYPQWRIAIEYEGDHHRGRSQLRRDVNRLNELRSASWLVLRFTADDVLRRPRLVVAQVAAAIKERR